MNKTLFIITFATVFSGIAFASEIPQINHLELLSALVEKCKNSELLQQCPKMAKAYPKLEALLEKGQENWTEKDLAKIEKYLAGHQNQNPAQDQEIQKIKIFYIQSLENNNQDSNPAPTNQE